MLFLTPEAHTEKVSTQLPDPQSFFVLISSSAEKAKIFTDVIANGSEFKIKSMEPFSNIFMAQPLEIEDKTLSLKCRVIGTSFLRKQDKELIFQFTLGDQLYISQTTFRAQDDFLFIDTLGKIFRVQRRDSFRVKLPSDFQGKLRLDIVDGQPHKRQYPLVDLSGGGCRFETPITGVSLASEQKWAGALLLPTRPEVPLSGVLRHFAEHPTVSNRQWVGTAFSTLSQPTRNKIEGLVMDLYRTYFSHLK